MVGGGHRFSSQPAWGSGPGDQPHTGLLAAVEAPGIAVGGGSGVWVGGAWCFLVSGDKHNRRPNYDPPM
eukprot:1296549-Prymnesium_polylepis.1